MKPKPKPRIWPPRWPKPHGAYPCSDCGTLGCLIPVPHKP